MVVNLEHIMETAVDAGPSPGPMMTIRGPQHRYGHMGMGTGTGTGMGMGTGTGVWTVSKLNFQQPHEHHRGKLVRVVNWYTG